MEKISRVLVGLAVVLVVTASASFGQDKQATVERRVQPDFRFAIQGPGQVEGGNTFSFVTSEFSFDKLVKGAPYSAQAVTEVTQILSDGNRIVNTNSAAVYRDGEGRTRREQTLKAIGVFSSSGEPFRTISINDPVAGVAYVLEPQSHTARKIQGLRMEANSGIGIKTISRDGETQNFTFNRTPNGEVQLKQATGEMKRRESTEQKGWVKEDLGTQTVEGVNAVGTKITITIAAGQIGNERPIEIVDERWFSPDLQTMVMTRHSDPRAGETVYRLTNINRLEPDHSLFEVPADYTLREEAPTRFRVSKPDKIEE